MFRTDLLSIIRSLNITMQGPLNVKNALALSRFKMTC